MRNNNKQTVGKIASDLLKKSNPVTAIDQMRESLTDYEKNIWETVASGIKIYPEDFYIIVITKAEKLMPNVLRNYFFCRLTCPTPDYDQVVYRYDKKKEKLDFIWVIPSRDASIYLKNNALLVSPEEKEILTFVLQFADGSLYKLAKKLNGEKEDSPLLI